MTVEADRLTPILQCTKHLEWFLLQRRERVSKNLNDFILLDFTQWFFFFLNPEVISVSRPPSPCPDIYPADGHTPSKGNNFTAKSISTQWEIEINLSWPCQVAQGELPNQAAFRDRVGLLGQARRPQILFLQEAKGQRKGHLQKLHSCHNRWRRGAGLLQRNGVSELKASRPWGRQDVRQTRRVGEPDQGWQCPGFGRGVEGRWAGRS